MRGAHLSKQLSCEEDVMEKFAFGELLLSVFSADYATRR
jgi:hypothetical protein